MKIAILVDRLENFGGVERVVLLMAKDFNADIYTGFWSKDTTFQEFEEQKVIELISQNSVLFKIPYRLRMRYLHHKFSKLRLKDYDFYILHGGKSLKAAKKHHPNLWYCHSPTRWLYDLYEDELNKRKFLERQLFRIFAYFLRLNDQECVKNVDKIVANSKNVQDRIRKFYDRDSNVVYPPVNTKKFKFIEYGDFYLSTARLDPIKRVDMIVRAFQEMPEKKLIVAGGGPSYEMIKSMAKGYNNIKVIGWVSDEEKLAELYGRCIATLYVSYKEDFGLIPIESMAAGKPCIGSNDGGMKETIVHEKTGLLIEPTVENIIKAVNWLSPERAKEMRKACEKRAKEFSDEKFIEGIKKAIDEVKDEK